MLLVAFIRAKLAVRKVDKVTKLVAPALAPANHYFQPEISRLVPRWDLNDDVLMTFVGYVAGVIDAAEYYLFCKPGGPRKGQLIIDLAFNRAIRALLNDLPGTDIFLDVDTGNIKDRLVGYGGGLGAISGMESNVAFQRAQRGGGDDFLCLVERVESGEKGYAPLNLFQLVGELQKFDRSEYDESIYFDSEDEARHYAECLSSSGDYEVKVVKDDSGWKVLSRRIEVW